MEEFFLLLILAVTEAGGQGGATEPEERAAEFTPQKNPVAGIGDYRAREAGEAAGGFTLDVTYQMDY